MKELYDLVDHIVILESDHTFTNRPKPYFFESHKQRYRAWSDKIVHIKHQSLCHNNPWQNEYDQRNALTQGLDHCKDDDIIIFNDVDEIPRPKVINYIKQHDKSVIYGLRMPLFNFKFNYMRVDPGPHDIWTTAARADWVKFFGGQMLRNQRHCLGDLPYEYRWNKKDHVQWNAKNAHVIDHGGWHFGYLGDNQWLRDKAQNTSHQEDITPEFLQAIDVDKSIRGKKCWNLQYPYVYEIVDLNNYFPESCRLYPQHCLPNSGIDALDILTSNET